MIKRRVFSTLVGLTLVLVPLVGVAQEREDRTLISMDAMRAIINEASGERAMHHIMEFVPYVRVRPIEEYKGHFRESDAMVKFANEYGYSSADIESFPTTGVQFQATQAELWMVEPEVRKLFDIYNTPLALAGGGNAPPGDLSGELVDIGMGQPQNVNGMDFKGKFVLVGQGGSRQGVQGNLGFIGYNNLHPDDQPDMMLFWVDGKQVTQFDAEHIGYTSSPRTGGGVLNGKSDGIIGGFAAFGFGFHAWHPSNAFDVYYDDIVLERSA